MKLDTKRLNRFFLASIGIFFVELFSRGGAYLASEKPVPENNELAGNVAAPDLSEKEMSSLNSVEEEKVRSSKFVGCNGIYD